MIALLLLASPAAATPEVPATRPSTELTAAELAASRKRYMWLMVLPGGVLGGGVIVATVLLANRARRRQLAADDDDARR